MIGTIFIRKYKEKDFKNLLCQKIEKNTRYEEVLSYITNKNTILVLRSQREFAYKHHFSEESILVSRLRELGVLRNE